MQLSDDKKMNGLIPGIIYGQNERVDELNERIYGRFIPDRPLQTNVDSRPTSTKYSHFPMIDLRKQTKVDIAPPLEYSPESTFIPTASRGPTNGYFDHVATESKLRNQFFAIQRGCAQGEFIPDSNSDLYKVSVPQSVNPVPQPHPDLFERPIYQNNRKILPHVGGDTFFNNTRTQLRGTGR